MIDTENSIEPWVLVRLKNKTLSIAWRLDGKELVTFIGEDKPEDDVRHIEDLPV